MHDACWCVTPNPCFRQLKPCDFYHHKHTQAPAKYCDMGIRNRIRLSRRTARSLGQDTTHAKSRVTHGLRTQPCVFDRYVDAAGTQNGQSSGCCAGHEKTRYGYGDTAPRTMKSEETRCRWHLIYRGGTGRRWCHSSSFLAFCCPAARPSGRPLSPYIIVL